MKGRQWAALLTSFTGQESCTPCHTHTDGHAHAAQPRRDQYAFRPALHQGGLAVCAEPHDPAPTPRHVDLVPGKDRFPKQRLQGLLDRCRHPIVGGGLSSKVQVSATAQQHAAFVVAEIVEAFVHVEGAAQGEPRDGRGKQHLSPGGCDVHIRKELACVPVRGHHHLAGLKGATIGGMDPCTVRPLFDRPHRETGQMTHAGFLRALPKRADQFAAVHRAFEPGARHMGNARQTEAMSRIRIPSIDVRPDHVAELLVQPAEPLGHSRVQRIVRSVHLMPTRRFEPDPRITQFPAQFQQALPSLLHPDEHGLGAFAVGICEQFARAAEAGEARVLHARTRAGATPLHHEHPMVRMGADVMQRGEETHDPAPHDRQMHLAGLVGHGTGPDPFQCGFPRTFHGGLVEAAEGAFPAGGKIAVIFPGPPGPYRVTSSVRPILRLFLICATLMGMAQRAQAQGGELDNVYIYGTIKDQYTAKKLDGVVVAIYKNGGKLQEVSSNASGKYEFNVDYGAEYKIVYNKVGWVSKNYTVDTRNVPEESRVGGEGMNIEMTLFQELPGMDFSILNQPIGKAKYYAEKSGLDWDWEYTAQIQNEVNRLIKEYNDRKKNEANADEQYTKAMQQGEAAMTAADYKKAVESFTTALTLKANDAKATARLSDAKMKLDDAEGEKKKNEQYAALIKEADAFFTKKDYQNAKTKYDAAADVKEEEQYPRTRSKECETLLADLAKKAEEERKAKELEEKYKAALTAADAAFKGEKYQDAQAKYTEASALKPAEQYPKDQLALCAKKIDELAKKAEEDKKQKELDAKYQAAIVAADAAFKAENFEQARGKYEEASALKAEEKYPKDQIALIAKKLEELARKAEEDRKKKELDASYQAAITAADGAFRGEKYDDAKTKYNEALGLKPDEKYPKDQLAAIEKKLEELARKAEEDRKNKDIEDRYNAAIAAADAAFRSKGWSEAKDQYKAALGIKPKEKYPQDQLAAIDKAMEDEARQAEEARKALELEERYAGLIDAGGEMFRNQNYQGARAKFVEASQVKPQERFPQDKIKEIDAKLQELERLAEEEKKRQEMEARYASLIASADKAFDGEAYPAALNDYKDALALKPAEAHPMDRIAAIEKLLDQAAQEKAEKDRLAREAQARDKQYADLMAKADAEFDAKRYSEARSAYVDASDVKPDEARPKDRIAEIDRVLDEQARKAEEDRLKAEADAAERARLEAQRLKEMQDKDALEARYREIIAAADLAFNAEDFDQARGKYTDALAVKPEEQYPKDRLALIENTLAGRQKAMDDAARLAEEQRRADEERRLREQQEADAARLAAEDERRKLDEQKAIEQRYLDVVSQADQAMGEERYTEARDLYTQALDIKPQETWPQAQIERIDKLLAEQERLRREAELAASRKEEPKPEPRRKGGSTIDRGKEQEAEDFMREARAREEAEKYDRIKKLKSDVQEGIQADDQGSVARREQAVAQNARTRDIGAGLYQGGEEGRLTNAAAIEAQKDALSEAERQRQERASGVRQAAYDGKMNTEQVVEQGRVTWDDRQRESAQQHQAGAEALAAQSEQRRDAAKERSDAAYEQARSQAGSMADLKERGDRIAESSQERVLSEKQALENRQATLNNNADDRRANEKARIDSTPLNQQRDFADYNRSKLAQEYPPGVTEESYTEGNKVIIRRIVVQGNKADEYSKVIAKWGTFYFKNGQSISEQIWTNDTEE